MFNRLTRAFCTLPRLIVVGFTLLTLDGCSKSEDNTAASSNPNRQAQAAQSAIAAARAEQDPRAAAMTDGGMAPAAPMAMGASAPAAPTAMGGPAADTPPANMGAAAGAPTGMARMLGQPPSVAVSTAAGLPAAIGAPHIYHLGADTFFLDQETALGLTAEQQKKLTALKESAAVAFATAQRKIDQKEQDLWVISSSETPDVARIEAKIGEIARLSGQQRMDFIRTVGGAVGVLSDAQRKAVASKAGPMTPPTMPSPAMAAPPAQPGAMPAGSAAPGAMPPAGMPMPAAAPSGGMGHM